MRYLRKYQSTDLDETAHEALGREVEAHLRTGLSLADWESLGDQERQAAVAASERIWFDRISLLARLLSARSTEDLKGMPGYAEAVVKEGLAEVVRNMGKPSFSGKVTK